MIWTRTQALTVASTALHHCTTIPSTGTGQLVKYLACNRKNLASNPGHDRPHCEYELLIYILAPTCLTILRLRRAIK